MSLAKKLGIALGLIGLASNTILLVTLVKAGRQQREETAALARALDDQGARLGGLIGARTACEGQAAIARQLAAAVPAAPPSTPSPARTTPEEQDPPAVAPEDEASADNLLNSAIARGTWTERDAQELRLLMPKLGDKAPDLIRRLVVAVNNKKIAPDVAGTLF